jgi:hypothetical protein
MTNKKTIPNTEEFKSYVIAMLNGTINMNDIREVMDYTGLDSRKVIYIREHYQELMEKHQDRIKLLQTKK